MVRHRRAGVRRVRLRAVRRVIVLSVQGTYDDAFGLCVEACQALGWYNRNTGYNPYTIEGKKTVSMEVAEQLGWEPPDTVVVPVGDGCILSGVWKGFVDLQRVGLISRLPRLVAVQAEGSQAIKQACDGDGKIRPVQVSTCRYRVMGLWRCRTCGPLVVRRWPSRMARSWKQ